MGKIKVLFSLSEKIDHDFRKFIALKYQTVEKGLLSHEVELALSHWVALHTNAQKEVLGKAPNPLPKVSKAYLSIKEYLVYNYFPELAPGATISERHLREAISQVRGSDRRTIQKWLKIFHQMGLTKVLSPGLWELL